MRMMFLTSVAGRTGACEDVTGSDAFSTREELCCAEDAAGT